MNHKKIILYSGLIYFSIYTWMSLHFFIQRCAFIDGPWMLISMANTQSFYLPLNRFSLAVTEWLPLIGVRMGMSFQSISILYSISYPVLFLVLFLLCIFWLKDYWAALCLVLVTCIGVKFTFYVLPLEGIIGATIGIVALSWSRKKEQAISVTAIFIAFLFSFLIVFAHPLNFIAVLCCCGFLLLEERQLHISRSLILSLGMTIVFILKNIILPVDSYETDIASEVYNNIYNFFHLQSHLIFFERLLHDYYWLPVFFSIVTVWLLVSKKYLQTVWYCITVSCFVALVNCRNYDNSFQFYIEHSFLSLPLIIVFPIVVLVEHTRINAKTAIVILSIIIVAVIERCTAIYTAHHYFDERIEWQKVLTKESLLSESKRVVVCQQNLQDKAELVPGKLPYETLFLSKIFFQNDVAVSTAWDSNSWKSGDSLVIYETELRIDRLNPQYFHFPNKAAEFICR